MKGRSIFLFRMAITAYHATVVSHVQNEVGNTPRLHSTLANSTACLHCQCHAAGARPRAAVVGVHVASCIR